MVHYFVIQPLAYVAYFTMFGSALYQVLAWHIVTCRAPRSLRKSCASLSFGINDDEEDPAEIARRLRRVKSTITRAVVQELLRGGRGRKPKLSDADVDAILKCLERMVDEARGRKEVTLSHMCSAPHVLVLEKQCAHSI